MHRFGVLIMSKSTRMGRAEHVADGILIRYSDHVYEYAVIGGRYRGILTDQWTESGADFATNFCRVRDIKHPFLPCLIYTPDRGWENRDYCSPPGFAQETPEYDELCRSFWETKVAAIYAQYANHIAVGVDAHD